MDFPSWVAGARDEHVGCLDRFLERHLGDLDRLAGWCTDTLRSGGRILLFGNGGSAADAQHLAAEFVNRFDRDRPALTALALTTDPSVVTSIGNDSSFDEIFSRQVEAHGRPGDVVIALSTSGNSPNVIRGLHAARARTIRSAAFLGKDGGKARSQADLALVVEGTDTARIQEVHIFAGHLLCRRVEDLVAEGGPVTSSRPATT